MKRGLALVAALAGTGMAAAATYELAEVAPRRSLGSWVSAVAIGDVSGDGLDDVVVGTTFYFDEENDYQLFVFFQNPDGGLDDPLKFKYAESSNSVDVKIGDLDNDGIMDVVAGHSGALTVLLADGVGGFRQASIVTPVTSTATNIKLLDVNADGNLDVIAQYWDEGASLLLGDGMGGVASARPLATGGRGYNDMATGDLTGDGRPDLVVVSQQSNQFHVYPHDGTDGFRAGIAYPVPSSVWGLSAVAVGDFNSDGWNDIAVTGGGNNPGPGVWLYAGSSTGVPDAPRKLLTHDIPNALISADLDHDGRSDLLVGHRGWATVGRYMQGEEGLGAELLTNTVFDGDPPALAVGDVNDDGCTDAAIADHNYGLIMLHGRSCAPTKAVSDFDGDGRSDLFWRQGASGANVIWKGADNRNPQQVVQVTNPAWQVKGHGDFDGDGRSDVLWRHAATGAAAIWRSADYRTQLPITRVTNLDWSIVGIGDFNGDGKDDVLWRDMRTGRNALWKSGDYRDQQTTVGVSDQRWTVVAVDDFNGDRRDDIMWRHQGSGRNAIWHSGDYRAQQPVAGVSDDDWQVAGTGDFNGDGVADVLWRHAGLGANALWYSADIADQPLVDDMGSVWRVAAVGDHDGNRSAEIVWRNRATGENRIWRSLNGALELPMTDVANQAWQVAPRGR